MSAIKLEWHVGFVVEWKEIFSKTEFPKRIEIAPLYSVLFFIFSSNSLAHSNFICVSPTLKHISDEKVNWLTNINRLPKTNIILLFSNIKFCSLCAIFPRTSTYNVCVCVSAPHKFFFVVFVFFCSLLLLFIFHSYRGQKKIKRLNGWSVFSHRFIYAFAYAQAQAHTITFKSITSKIEHWKRKLAASARLLNLFKKCISIVFGTPRLYIWIYIV